MHFNRIKKQRRWVKIQRRGNQEIHETILSLHVFISVPGSMSAGGGRLKGPGNVKRRRQSINLSSEDQ